MDALAKYRHMTWNTFQICVGLADGTISHMSDTISAHVFNRVTEAMPEVNPIWLLVGRGEMLLTDQQAREREQQTRLANAEKTVAEQAGKIRLLEAETARLKTENMKLQVQVDTFREVLQRQDTNADGEKSE